MNPEKIGAPAPPSPFGLRCASATRTRNPRLRRVRACDEGALVATGCEDCHADVPRDRTALRRRDRGALKNVGHRVGRSTIARMLKAQGIPPVPGRPTSRQVAHYHGEWNHQGLQNALLGRARHRRPRVSTTTCGRVAQLLRASGQLAEEILDARSATPAIAIVLEPVPAFGPQGTPDERGIGGSVSVPTLEANRDQVDRRAHTILNLCDGV